MLSKCWLQLITVLFVTNTAMTVLDFGGGSFNLGDIFNKLAGNVTCPSYCTCEKASLEDYFRNFFRENNETIGIHYRSIENGVISDILNGLKNNFLLQLFGGGVITDMTCQVNRNNVSLEALVSSAPGFLVTVTVICDDNTSLHFDTYPVGKLMISLKIFRCDVSSSSKLFTFPIFNVLLNLELDNVRGQWLETLSLENLGQLRVLKVVNCDLDKLPAICTNTSLPSLFLLDLRHNGLENFDCEIGWGTIQFFVVQPSIDTINLEDNDLVEIPRCILQKTLRVPYISLAKNRLTNTGVFREVNSYINTATLNLGYNQIKELDFLTYANMSLLDLSHNQITRLTLSSFRKVDKYNVLETLDLSHNQISSIEYGSLDFTPLLRYLDLSYNRLQTFDFEYSPVYVERVTIDLRYNRMKYPPFQSTSYFGPHSVKAFAAGNPFSCDCALLEFIPIYRQLNPFKGSNAKLHSTLFNAARPFSDAVEYRCSAPFYLSGERVLKLPDSEKCPIVENCPPVCRCSRLNDHVTVNCESAGLEILPNHFPEARSLSINLKNNSMKIVDYKPYFSRTKDIDLSYNRIRTVSTSAIFALSQISEVQLHSNRLSRLPDSSKDIQKGEAFSMTLHDNPWQCSCDTIWMKAWLNAMGSYILMVSDIKCVNDPFEGIAIVKIEAEDMDCDSPRYIITAITLGITSAILVLIAVVIFVFRLEIKILLYVRFHWTMLKKDTGGTDLPYDVFLSFSQSDYKWIVHTLTPFLENRTPAYKLCIHYRDFPVGEPIVESINRAIEGSRCTLMYVTNEFLNSEWCMYEFKSAHQRLFETRDSKVVMILQDDLDTRGLDKTLGAYVKTHTYIRLKDRLFWEKLIYALPKLPENTLL